MKTAIWRCAQGGPRLLLACIAACVIGPVAGLSNAAAAQPPVDTAVTESAAERLSEAASGNIAVLLETEVVAGVSAFPAEPLPAEDVFAPNRMPTPANQTGNSIAMISEEQVNATSPRNGQTKVAEVLRGQLGLDVVRQGGLGRINSLFVRGANSQHTKVL